MKKVYLSVTAGKALIKYLIASGYEPVLIDGNDSRIEGVVATHPDIHMCQLGTCPGSEIYFGDDSKPGSSYPEDVIYNAVCTEKYFIHNLKHTDTELLAKVGGRQKLHVSQGYTRCCCLPVDENSFITSDLGIAKALTPAGADVLLIEKGHVKLKGFSYGFLGGCAGKIVKDGKQVMVFNGDLSSHPDFIPIMEFLEKRSICYHFFEDYELEDIGSIIPE